MKASTADSCMRKLDSGHSPACEFFFFPSRWNTTMMNVRPVCDTVYFYRQGTLMSVSLVMILGFPSCIGIPVRYDISSWCGGVCVTRFPRNRPIEDNRDDRMLSILFNSAGLVTRKGKRKGNNKRTQLNNRKLGSVKKLK